MSLMKRLDSEMIIFSVTVGIRHPPRQEVILQKIRSRPRRVYFNLLRQLRQDRVGRIELLAMLCVVFCCDFLRYNRLQANLFIVDFRGPFEKVHYRVVHYIETFLQKMYWMITGPDKKSLIARCPLKRGSIIKRFDCIMVSNLRIIVDWELQGQERQNCKNTF